MKDNLPITLRGKQALEEELKRLIREERPSAVRAIEEARALGDISENADYDAAKERQGWVEARITEIQSRLAGAEIINPAELRSDKVIFGASVELNDVEEEKKVAYQIVGPEEADIKAGRISILSPLAKALVGKKKGEIAEVKAPNSVKEYEILKIYFQ